MDVRIQIHFCLPIPFCFHFPKYVCFRTFTGAKSNFVTKGIQFGFEMIKKTVYRKKDRQFLYVQLINFVLLCLSCTGVGREFITTSGQLMVNKYFRERVGLAMGLATAGSGVGSFCFAPLTNYLFQEFGFEVWC